MDHHKVSCNECKQEINFSDALYLEECFSTEAERYFCKKHLQDNTITGEFLRSRLGLYKMDVEVDCAICGETIDRENAFDLSTIYGPGTGYACPDHEEIKIALSIVIGSTNRSKRT